MTGFRRIVLGGLLLAALAGCGSSASPKLLVITPNPSVPPVPLPASNLICRPLPEKGPTGSNLVFNGPCSFTETARVKCVQITDDYYAFITRRLPQGATLDVTINVEFYTHPDTYRGLVQVYLGVVKGTQLYSWGNRQATATVEPGAHRLTLAFTRAGPWAGTLAADMETISGTLVCKSLEH